MNTHVFRIICFIILCTVVAGCTKKKSQEKESPKDMIIGEWHAHWKTTADEITGNIDPKNLQMDGRVKFMQNGEVEISAFGYPGCIFSEDTLTSTLHWNLGDTELRLIDKGDDQGLAYHIENFDQQELKLSLLEDIQLTLSRN